MLILGQTQGLAGNFNGDSSDDLMRPDGTTISTNSSLRDIHYEFGEKCESNFILYICKIYKMCFLLTTLSNSNV